MTVADAAKQKLHNEAAFAEESKRAYLRNVELSSNEESIAQYRGYFFPDLEKRQANLGWSNFSNNISPKHQLLLSPPPILNVAPKEPDQFRLDHGITAETAIELCKAGLLVPSIYDRSEASWERAEHLTYLLPLIEMSIVGGARADAFLSARSPNYTAAKRKELEERLLRALHGTGASDAGRAIEILQSLDFSQNRQVSNVDDPEALRKYARQYAYRWLYLLALSPDQFQVVEEMVEGGNLTLALPTLRRAKHVASPYTAAMGGDFIWNTVDLPDALINEDDHAVHQHDFENAIEYLYLDLLKPYLIHLPPEKGLEEERLLLDYMLSPGFVERKARFRRLVHAVAKLGHSADSSSASELAHAAHDLERDFRARLTAVTFANGFMLLPITTLFSFVDGTGLTGLAWALFKGAQYAATLSLAASPPILRAQHPEEHYVLYETNKLPYYWPIHYARRAAYVWQRAHGARKRRRSQ